MPRKKVETIDQWFKRRTMKFDKRDYAKQMPFLVFRNLARMKYGFYVTKKPEEWDELFDRYQREGRIQ